MSDNNLQPNEIAAVIAMTTEHPDQSAPSSLAAPAGSVTPDALIIAFVQGAQWWEYHKTSATMWASDRDQAEGEAKIRLSNGTLGKSPNAQAHLRRVSGKD